MGVRRKLTKFCVYTEVDQHVICEAIAAWLNTTTDGTVYLPGDIALYRAGGEIVARHTAYRKED